MTATEWPAVPPVGPPGDGGPLTAPPPPPAAPPPAAAGPRFAEQGAVRVRLWEAVTPFGWSVVALGAVAWILAVVTGWAELGAISVGCLLAVATGIGFLLAGKARLSVRLELGTPRVVVGEEATTNVEMVNESRRRMLPVRMEARVGSRGVAHLHVPTLAAGAAHAEEFRIPTRRRSVVPVGPVRSVQGDPLGLVRREALWTGTEHLYVHPRTVLVPRLATGWLRDLEGETTNDRSPSDVAFHTLREYVPGDDRRHIHWRTTARQMSDRLMVKEFVDTRRTVVGLALSCRGEDYASEEEAELAVSALASVGVRALGDDQDVTCLAGHDRVPSFHGATFLDGLAGLEIGPGADLLATVGTARTLLSGASVCLLVTGSQAADEDVRRAGDRLGRGTRVVVLRAQMGAAPTVRSDPRQVELRLGRLDDLAPLVWAVAS